MFRVYYNIEYLINKHYYMMKDIKVENLNNYLFLNVFLTKLFLIALITAECTFLFLLSRSSFPKSIISCMDLIVFSMSIVIIGVINCYQLILLEGLIILAKSE